MFNNGTAATCPQSVSVKSFENRSIFDEDMDNHKVGRFFETPCSDDAVMLGCCSAVTKCTMDRKQNYLYVAQLLLCDFDSCLGAEIISSILMHSFTFLHLHRV